MPTSPPGAAGSHRAAPHLSLSTGLWWLLDIPDHRKVSSCFCGQACFASLLQCLMRGCWLAKAKALIGLKALRNVTELSYSRKGHPQETFYTPQTAAVSAPVLAFSPAGCSAHRLGSHLLSPGADAALPCSTFPTTRTRPFLPFLLPLSTQSLLPPHRSSLKAAFGVLHAGPPDSLGKTRSHKRRLQPGTCSSNSHTH